MDTKHFKEALAEAIDEHFAPIREKYNNLINDEHKLKNILENGAQRAREIAAKNIAEIKDIIGLKLWYASSFKEAILMLLFLFTRIT